MTKKVQYIFDNRMLNIIVIKIKKIAGEVGT